MIVLTLAAARARFAQVLDAVVADHDPAVIVGPGGDAVVLVSLADWQAREATEHLLSSPRNAERLRRAVCDLDGGEPV